MPNMEPFHVSDAAVIAMAARYDPMVHRLVHHDGTDLFAYEGPRGGSLQDHVAGQIAMVYPINPAMMPGVLETLYHNGYVQYGWFLSLRPQEVTLNDFLYGRLDSLHCAEPPPAPSRAFEQAGKAMLRANESPEYWTTGAIAVNVLGATGLRRQGTFHISIHARGRLMYRWQNTQQYEVFSDPDHGMNCGQVPLIGYTVRSHRSRVRPVPENSEDVCR